MSHQSLKLLLGATGINTDTWCHGEGQMSTVTPGYWGQWPEAARWASEQISHFGEPGKPSEGQWEDEAAALLSGAQEPAFEAAPRGRSRTL